jgi:hypothetical protein
MDDLARVWTDLIGRADGPFTFRFVLQPTMAALFALRDGLADARNGRPAYLWTIFTNARETSRLLREGWHAVFRIIVLGVVMDLIYQWRVFQRIYPLELVLIVLLLGFVPYLLLRGPVNRVAQRWMHP